MSKKVTTFVNNCIIKYTELFTDDWILDLDWSSVEKANESFRTGRGKIEEFNRVCFKNIALSFLSGEYIIDRKTFEGVKSSFKRYWQQEHLCPNLPDEDKDIFKIKSKLYKFYEDLDNQIRALFYTYAHFVISVDEKLEYAQHEYLFKAETQGLREVWDFRYFMYLRNIFIPLCDIEHRLEFCNSIRTQIAVYKEQLEQIKKEEADESIKTVLNIAIYKTIFLLKNYYIPLILSTYLSTEIRRHLVGILYLNCHLGSLKNFIPMNVFTKIRDIVILRLSISECDSIKVLKPLKI